MPSERKTVSERGGQKGYDGLTPYTSKLTRQTREHLDEDHKAPECEGAFLPEAVPEDLSTTRRQGMSLGQKMYSKWDMREEVRTCEKTNPVGPGRADMSLIPYYRDPLSVLLSFHSSLWTSRARIPEQCSHKGQR